MSRPLPKMHSASKVLAQNTNYRIVRAKGSREHLCVLTLSSWTRPKRPSRRCFARCAQTGGSVHILALVPQQTFNAFGGVQATIEQEARARRGDGEQRAATPAKWAKCRPSRCARPARRRDPQVYRGARQYRRLGAGDQRRGRPGAAGHAFRAGHAGQLPCLLYLVPGGHRRDRSTLALAKSPAWQNWTGPYRSLSVRTESPLQPAVPRVG